MIKQGNQRWQIPRPATCQCLATFTPLKFVDDVMSNINCGIGVLHVKRQILTYFLWRHLSVRSSFYCFSWLGIQRDVYKNNIENCLWLSFCDMTVPSKCNVPSLWHCPLTYERQFFQWIDSDPISVLYEFQIDISTNSWEINTKIWVYAFYMLNVAHVKNDVKWRPIVTKFGTLIENMSRTGLYDCHIF